MPAFDAVAGPVSVQLLSAGADGDANTILLLHCDGADGATAFPDSSPWPTANTVTPHGTAKVGTAQSKFGTASFVGDGTAGCCLTVAPSANFNFGTGDFTVDFWFRLPSTSTLTYLVQKANGTSPPPFWSPFYIYANGTPGHVAFALSSTGTSWDITAGVDGGAVFAANTWNHYALVRQGTKFTQYLNGVANGTITSSASLASNTLPLAIGGYSDAYSGSATGYLNGTIDELRISNVARWAANFTPPASPYGPQSIDGDANTILLLHCDGNDATSVFPDQSGHSPANTVTPTGTTVSAAQGKFGQSASFTGASQRIIATPSTNFDFGSGNFTIDFWFRLNNLTANHVLVAKGLNSGTMGLLIYFNGTNVVTYASFTGTGWSLNLLIAGASTPAVNTWNHFALVRNGNTWTAYLNGVAGTPQTVGGTIPVNTYGLSIGSFGDGSPGTANYLSGYVDEFRVSNNARWTAAFTPPQNPYSFSNFIQATEAPDTAAFAGTAAFVPVTGPLAATEAADFAYFVPVAADPNTILLLHFDGPDGSINIVDSSGLVPANVIARGGFAVTAAQSKFGQGGVSTGAANSNLTVTPDDTFDFGSSDFTIDFWIKLTAVPTTPFYGVCKSPSTYGPFAFFIQSGSQVLNLYMSSNGTSWNLVNGSTFGTLSLNTWTHIALVRKGTALNGYVNGVSALSGGTAGLNPVANSNPFSIGGGSDGANCGGVPIYFDEFRVSNNARWSANFTPPTGPYPVGSAPSGTLVAVEAADTAAFVGTVVTVVTGTLAATDAADAAAFVIDVPPAGLLAATETVDIAAFVGTVTTAVSGILAATETSDAAAIVGSVVNPPIGTLAAIDAPDTAVLVGTVTLVTGGIIAATEASDAASFAGAITIVSTGILAATEAPDLSAFFATTAWTGILAATETLPDTAAFTGTLSWSSVLAATESADTAIFIGAAEVFGGLDVTEVRDTALFAGALTWIAVLDATEVADDAHFTSVIVATGSLIAAEAQDSAAFIGATAFNVVLAATEAADSAAFIATISSGAILLANEAPDLVALFGINGWGGTFALTEDTDVAAFLGNVTWAGRLAAIEAAQDSALFTGSVAFPDVLGMLAATEAQDTALFHFGLATSGILVSTDGGDTASFTGDVAWDGILAASEIDDTASFTATAQWNAFLAAMEAPDAILITGDVAWGGILAATEANDTARFRPFAPVLSVPEIEHVNGRAWAPIVNGRMWVEKINGREAIT